MRKLSTNTFIDLEGYVVRHPRGLRNRQNPRELTGHERKHGPTQTCHVREPSGLAQRTGCNLYPVKVGVMNNPYFLSPSIFLSNSLRSGGDCSYIYVHQLQERSLNGVRDPALKSLGKGKELVQALP